MFGIYFGTLANALMVIVGTACGLIFKGERLSKIGQRVFEVFAIFVMAMGFSGASDMSEPLLMLASIIIGVGIGEVLDLDKQFNKVGNFLQKKFSKGNDSEFSKGFVEGSLLFCIGSMTIMGAFESGLSNEHTIYLTKGVIDMVSAMTFAMGSGIGVGFSSICIVVYQGLLTTFASFLAPILSTEIIAVSTSIGSLFLVAIGLNMLKITNLKVANFLPAMFIPFIYQLILFLI